MHARYSIKLSAWCQAEYLNKLNLHYLAKQILEVVDWTKENSGYLKENVLVREFRFSNLGRTCHSTY